MQQSVARGFQAAGENGGGAQGMAFMGMGVNAVGGVMNGMQQPEQPQQQPKPEVDPYEEIKKYKQLLDDGIITEEEFDKKKKELLGL